nr:envelope stress response membrane protein PspB [uncultured Sphingomonas sp.]
MEDVIVPFIAITTLFIGLPWLIFHYVTKWKTAKVLTGDDEKLLDDLYETARRLDDRLQSIERIMAAENPDWHRAVPPASRGAETSLLERYDPIEQLDRPTRTRTR